MSRFTNPVPQFFLNDGTIASSGRMYFYENKNYAALKATYSNPDNTVANTNPLILDGQGRIPPCFGDGLYSVKFYASNPDNPSVDGALQWPRDDVSLSELSGQWGLWNAAETYSVDEFAKDPTDGNYYQLWGAPTSKGEQPSTNLTKWEQVVFITVYNSNKTYNINDNVVNTGLLYRCNTNGTIGIAPPSAQWDNLTFNQPYTEGTFTPVAVGSTTAGVGTYTSYSQTGNYTRIGNRVFFRLAIGWSAHTGTGELRIAGLPFVASSSISAGTPCANSYYGLLVASGKTLGCRVVSGFSYIQLSADDPAGGAVFTPVAMDSSVGELIIAGSYDV